MTKLVNAANDFADEALAGFVAAHGQYAQKVHGGVVRSTQSPAGEVALVLGGGGGHYPAFAGWVGPGMGHGASCGHVFASPSASQVYSVARAADNGGGVVLGYGNYSGDVLHFGQAAERLRADGIDVRCVATCDDIASAAPEKRDERRGIAGNLVVFKIAGAAAEAGLDLDGVERVARAANAATRTLGVAFAGCTLPGAGQPLFTVAAGAMATGLGIHGEPGIGESELGSANDVADLLVDGLLAEELARSAGGYQGRVAVVLNGLGSTTFEELFVVHGRVAQRLRDADCTVVEPEVGPQVTSLDMAGLSLTLTFLDDELERFWVAPADTPAFRRGAIPARPARTEALAEDEAPPIADADPESQALAATLVDALRAAAAAAAEHESELGDLDAVAGDGDHGQSMAAGSSGALREAEKVLRDGAGAQTLLARAGEAWAESAGGTAGAMWGAALGAAGATLSDTAGATPADLVAAVESAAKAVVDLGGAAPGDKTIIDALHPFEDVLRSTFDGGAAIGEAWQEAATAASAAAAATADIAAQRGRAQKHGDRSLGHPDPGATSFALLMTAVTPLVQGTGDDAHEH